MVRKLVCGGLGGLLLATAAAAFTAAQASEATTLADRAGFLLGHAQRCGVAEDRLLRSAELMKAVVAAFSSDADDREAAQGRFGDGIIAGALAKLLGDPLPSCAAVRSTLAEFERHRHPVQQREGQMARTDHSDATAARRARSDAKPAPNPANTAKRTSTKREDLSAEQRAALELRRAAQEIRGKPPSI